MNRKTLYLTIIAVTIIFIIILIAVSAYFVYTSAAEGENIVDRLDDRASQVSAVLCDPILADRSIPITFGNVVVSTLTISTPEARQFCQELLAS